VFTHLIPIGSVAWRATLVACAGGATASFAVWLALSALEAPPCVAMLSAWIFAFGNIVWIRSTRTDVHALELGFEALALACAVVYARKRDERYLFLATTFFGFALATHPNALWVGPGLLVMMLWGARHVRARSVAIAVVTCAAPLLLYLYMLPRSIWLSRHAVDPTLAIGVPPGQPFWNYGDPSTIRGFVWMITGQQWNTHPILGEMLWPTTYAHGLAFFFTNAMIEYGWPLLAVAALGFLALCFDTLAVAVGLGISLVTVSAFANAYSIENDQARYLMSALWIGSVFIGFAFAALSRVKRLHLAAAALAAIVFAGMLWSNHGLLHARADAGASKYLARVRSSTGESDVIVAGWTYVTPLGYAKYVEHSLSGRIPVNAEPPQAIALAQTIAATRQTDLVLEKPVAVPGFYLVSLDRGFPHIYRLERASSVTKKNQGREERP